jgi:hypothetical protein
MACATDLLPVFAIIFALHGVVFRSIVKHEGLRPALGLVWALLPAIVALPIYLDLFRPAACARADNLITWLVLASFVAAASLYLAVRIRTNLKSDAPPDEAPGEYLAGGEFRLAFKGRSSGQAPAAAALMYSVPLLGAAIGALWLRLCAPGAPRR